MAWFRRNKVQQNTIPELQEYYNAERRERSGLSWLLALVSVACAALVLIGLVFGGKWLYNKLARNMDKNKPTTVQTENNPNNQPATPAETDTASTDTAAPAPSTASTPAANTPASAPTTSTPSTSTAPTTASPAPAATPAPAAPSATSGAVASSTSPLPHTGPAGTLTVFLTTAILATIVRYTLFKRRFLK